VEASYSGLVRGPSAVYPRGGIWMFSIWYAAMYVVLLFAASPSAAFAVVAFALFAGAAATITWLLSRASYRSLQADARGIRLGPPAKAREVPWAEVRQLRISADKDGALLEVLLDQSAEVPRRGLARKIGELAYFSLPFVGARNCTPEILIPLPDPPRYRVPLASVTPEALRSALAALAPDTVPITVSG
jgi:hypothetical protein